MRVLIGEGVTQWVEVGAGAVLTGLLRNIDSTQTCQKFGEAADVVNLA
jgi:malonyl CoA-acyl carrier protein transacylase